MALVICPDCSKPVSDKAEKCLNCGLPILALVNQIYSENVNCNECKKDYSFNYDICPHCGLFNSKKRILMNPLERYVEQSSNQGLRNKFPKSRGFAIFLALIFGGFGAHKFYLEKTGQGFLYLIFFWTCIPLVFSLFEAINYLVMGKDEFERIYSF